MFFQNVLGSQHCFYFPPGLVPLNCLRIADVRLATILPEFPTSLNVCSHCAEVVFHYQGGPKWKKTTLEPSYLFPFTDRYRTIWD